MQRVYLLTSYFEKVTEYYFDNPIVRKILHMTINRHSKYFIIKIDV